ncbi:MAG: AraC family ligand binding domain-containing protein, partial [Gorillibacterium sp.]|nr:AraC family ligand binding domain-containing protein [Gorillibacterium sp.]
MQYAGLSRLSTAGEFVVKPSYSLSPRTIKDYELVFFPAGTGTVYQVGNYSVQLDKPSIVITRPGEEHSYSFDPDRPTRHVFIHFNLDDDSSTEGHTVFEFQSLDFIPVLSVKPATLIPPMLTHLLSLMHHKPYHWR